MSKPKRSKKPRVKKIVLEPGEAVHVEIPADHTPVVATDPEKGHVHIVPVKRRTLWEYLFGSDR